MAITRELQRLGNSARRLNAGSDRLNQLIERIDQLLGTLMIGLDYVHARPIDEWTTSDHNGKRVIEISYVGYMRTQRSYHLAIKTVKVLESKLSAATQSPGEVTPLLQAPRRLRYAAVDVLPHVVHGLAEQVDEMVGSLEQRCQTAESLVQNLEQVASMAPMADESGSRRVMPPIAPQVPVQPQQPQQTQPVQQAHSSGQWVAPGQSARQPRAAATKTMAPDDGGRKTVAIGSDSFNDGKPR